MIRTCRYIVLAAILLAFAGSAGANTIYALTVPAIAGGFPDRNGGDIAIGGTITTDGTQGSLSIASILSWNITGSDNSGGLAFSIGQSDVSLANVFADSSGLYIPPFSPSSTLAYMQFLSQMGGSCIESALYSCFFNVLNEWPDLPGLPNSFAVGGRICVGATGALCNHGTTPIQSASPYYFAFVSVPLPPAAFLLTPAVGLLGFGRRKRA